MKPLARRFYRVGGCVRDRLLGLKPSDIDNVVVAPVEHSQSIDEAWCWLLGELATDGYQVLTSNREHLTLRIKLGRCVEDLVLARKELGLCHGRTPNLALGTLHDDLARRDFTINAMAEGFEGELIDPFGGLEHLRANQLVAVGEPLATLMHDPLRLLRALRFQITRGFLSHVTPRL